MQFEKRDPDDLDIGADVEVSNYLDLAKPYLPAVVLGVALLGLIASGIVPVPAALQPDFGPPTVEDVPGHAERVNGIDLVAVETRVLDRLNDQRRADGIDRLTIDEELAAMAAFENRRRVVHAYGDREVDGSLDEFGYSCPNTVRIAIFGLHYTVDDSRPIESVQDESQLARALATAYLAEPAYDDALLEATTSAGMDVHVGPDGRIFAVLALC